MRVFLWWLTPDETNDYPRWRPYTYHTMYRRWRKRHEMVSEMAEEARENFEARRLWKGVLSDMRKINAARRRRLRIRTRFRR